MKAAFWHGARDVRVVDVPEPQVQPGKVKIRVAWCGICGTDLHEYMAGPIFLSVEPHPLTKECAPLILGHEFAGEVVEIGEGVTSVKVGDRVAVEPVLACGRCHACKSGRQNHCEVIGCFGLNGGGGGFSELTVVSEEMVHLLPDHITYEQAALIEPTSVALQAVRESSLKAGDSCAVFGTGPIGLLTILAAKAAGASPIIAVEVSEQRRQMALKLGASHAIDPTQTDAVQKIRALTNGGADVCFEVTGVEPGLLGAIESSRTGGQTVIVSVWEKPVTVSPNAIVLRERHLMGSFGYGKNIFPAVIRLIAEGRIQVDELITKKIPLSDITEGGFEELARNKGHIKILVSPSAK
ncbi:butanediol dehydrogenase [Brevibacillus choshinensis]|uniref:Butanediol dehydrogenase n=1 Tax=Brevibacillus choshinensis TaxID=54911 RepID=A0ABR5NEH1_BRECH|nr:2,3-butanediol dehydrogenase [Brevibacillus choshinensis]KQL49796.1 butanediol dehydrogenase [Brevibacillus choshinensis]